MPEVRQGETYMEGLRTAHKNAGTYVDDANMFTNPAYYEAYQNGKYIDWVDELLHTGTVQNYSLFRRYKKYKGLYVYEFLR